MSALPTPDKDMAMQFLAGLDPTASRFTFQFFSDGAGSYAEIFHGTMNEVWPKVLALNTPHRGVGVFVTIAETDLKGRKNENVIRPRALFADADNKEQEERCLQALTTCGVTPSMIVKSGRGHHFYFCADEIPRDQFSSLQKSLSEKLGTDAAVHDLPRVMRLPGTLHLKNPAKPQFVKLIKGPITLWELTDLIARLGLSTAPTTAGHSQAGTASALPKNSAVPDWALTTRPASAFAELPKESLAAGFEANIEEIRSAVAAIPPSAISTEPEWMKFARALAYEAAIINTKQAEELWKICDEASARAPGYNQEDNRRRFERYMREAPDQENPITISTIFHMAHEHGWLGWSPSVAGDAVAAAEAAAAPGNVGRAVHISALPLVPPKRQWLHGIDLIRGAVTVLVAPGGRAKSTWLLACALACTSGRPLLGSHVFGGPLRVLCLSTEDGMPEMALRLRAAMMHYKLTDADVPGLHVIGADRWGVPLLQMHGNRAVLSSAGKTALGAELDHITPDVLIIDPLINMLGGVSANDNAAAALLMGDLVGLATSRRMALALAHHTAKGRDVTSAESAMGAASFTNLARIALSIEPLDEKNAGSIGLPPWEAKSVFRLIPTKQNFSAPNANDRWFRLASVTMPNAEPPIYSNGDEVAVVVPFQPGNSGPAFPDGMVRGALLTIDRASPSLTMSKNSTRHAAPVIADAIKLYRGGQASEVDAKALLDHLIKNAGLVAVADVKVSRGGKGSDTRKGLILTAAGRAALQQTAQSTPANPTPQSPQTPARTLQGDAGGDPVGSPATQGGCGGNTGEMPSR